MTPLEQLIEEIRKEKQIYQQNIAQIEVLKGQIDQLYNQHTDGSLGLTTKRQQRLYNILRDHVENGTDIILAKLKIE